MSDNNMNEQKSILVVRAPLSSDGFVSIHFSSADGRLMNDREWWHLKQVIELASRAFVKEEKGTRVGSGGLIRRQALSEGYSASCVTMWTSTAGASLRNLLMAFM